MEYVQLAENQTLPDIAKIAPFRCVVVIEEDVADQRRNEISKWLVKSGCLYMMAWGKECESWDTSVDLANLEEFNFNSVPEESFVSTTWHQDESLSEVFWHSKHCAFHSTVNIENTVVLHLSAVNKKTQYVCKYMSA
uniref:DUF7684 domain-containing protein n=1 Tax=uncultured Thiotrichaceae bacterium TaxID=298394 RepID=A0A6S6UF65_9GAMM|nr:MAG: Unknown protein [uncultured Thiotrichaceae bacterium]